MITRSKQNWTIGNKVNVGFLRNLEIVSIELTPSDSLPDVYHLISLTGIRYSFTPHNGLTRE